ncbi:FGGY carbohydrate kinase domain-containing protein isoform X2 [Arctopsyche grandis]|uniref:FGGY carbohydrate kinase domain-containing protein isoform X2 n=1 Tax=Arctopsyche grandis TaxID=121162 RepID=UPI00406D66CF
MKPYNALFVGVDIGTGSARAALVTDEGKVLKTAVKTIQTWNPITDHYEQSSENIWESCKYVVKEVINGFPADDVKGIGFDATCSLVVLSKELKPITVSLSEQDQQNVILWMDHRAKLEAEFINNTKHSVLKYVGGNVSLEMQMPKLLWLKKNLPKTWNDIGFVFDLPDYLTWRATGSNSRSLCSVVCKWNYEANDSGMTQWNAEFLEQISLRELTDNNHKKIGNSVLAPGAPCGSGLTKDSATDLGLLPGTPVGTSIIDAHAGGLGMLGCFADNVCSDFESRLSLICGTSTCHMAVNKLPIFTTGIWGPYYSAMVPELWLNEAGQSASGALIDHIISSHPATITIKAKCPKYSLVQDYLNKLIIDMVEEKQYDDNCYLTKTIHIWPDYHGNRSPIADSNLLGMISGLTLTNDEENLALIYLATLQALAYGTRHIIESLKTSGYDEFKSLLICGGLSHNSLFTQIQADVVGLPLLCPIESESVLMGAAILGACGAKYFPNNESC